jgi:hypothetical protein
MVNFLTIVPEIVCSLTIYIPLFQSDLFNS